MTESGTETQLTPKEMVEDSGLTQKEFTAELKKHLTGWSESTMSRVVNGERSLKPNERTAFEAVLAEHVDSSELSKPGPAGEFVQVRRWWVVALCAVFVIVAGAVVYLLLRSTSPPAEHNSSGPNPAEQIQVRPVNCDHYEVAAKDVTLRDRHGTPTQTQLLGGTVVTVKARDLVYWEVAVDGGPSGWVMPDYLKPSC